MGVVDLITALGKVATERSQANFDNYAAIDMATGRPMAGDTRMLPPMENPGIGGFITDVVRASQDRMTSAEAAKVGLPDAQGLSREHLSDLMALQLQPGKLAEQKADVESKNALATDRNSKAAARSGIAGLQKDPDFAMANENLAQLITKNPLVALQAAEPETRLSMLNDQLAIIKAAKRGKPLPVKPGAEKVGSGGKKYDSPEQIRDDSSLSREQKLELLRKNFPDKFK